MTTDNRQQTTDYGQQTTDNGLRTTKAVVGCLLSVVLYSLVFQLSSTSMRSLTTLRSVRDDSRDRHSVAEHREASIVSFRTNAARVPFSPFSSAYSVH